MLAIFLFLAAGCIASGPSYHGPWIHRSLYEEPRRRLPERVLVLPPRVVATKQEEHSMFTIDPEASLRLAEELERGMATHLAALGVFEPVPAALDLAERASVAAHAELFAIVARAASLAGNGGSTPDYKLREFDYTLGPGLAGMARESGAQAALMLTVQGMGIFAGLVDLATGDLLWLQAGWYFPEDPHGDLWAAFEHLWQDYPGLGAFARVREES